MEIQVLKNINICSEEHDLAFQRELGKFSEESIILNSYASITPTIGNYFP